MIIIMILIQKIKNKKTILIIIPLEKSNLQMYKINIDMILLIKVCNRF